MIWWFELVQLFGPPCARWLPTFTRAVAVHLLSALWCPALLPLHCLLATPLLLARFSARCNFLSPHLPSWLLHPRLLSVRCCFKSSTSHSGVWCTLSCIIPQNFVIHRLFGAIVLDQWNVVSLKALYHEHSGLRAWHTVLFENKAGLQTIALSKAFLCCKCFCQDFCQILSKLVQNQTSCSEN